GARPGGDRRQLRGTERRRGGGTAGEAPRDAPCRPHGTSLDPAGRRGKASVRRGRRASRGVRAAPPDGGVRTARTAACGQPGQRSGRPRVAPAGGRSAVGSEAGTVPVAVTVAVARAGR